MIARNACSRSNEMSAHHRVKSPLTISEMRSEIDADKRLWSIPSGRTKNSRAHIVHLSEAAWAVIRDRQRSDGYVFATSRDNHYQSFGQGKPTLDKLCGVTGWRLHDLRRTIVSGMARLGVPPHIADKILNHQSGTISGVAAVYQRHEFLEERKAALDLWAKHVGQLLSMKRFQAASE